MKRLAALYDNAMLYKDLTQWIRSRGFFTLFIGLLSICELIALFFSSLDTGEQPAGPIAFGFLVGALAIFMVIIAFQGMALTGKEFGDRTFELYEMAGMSLEKMVFGKFSSMMAQFLFGFFCIVPFMFFSYLLGGLDFFTVLGWILFIAFFAPPLFLVFLAFAFIQKGKGTNTIGRFIFGAFVFVFLGIGRSIFYVAMLAGPGGVSFGPAGIVNWLVSFDPKAVFGLSMAVALNILLCLLAFYVACHNISPVTDSRETAIKVSGVSLCIAWMLSIASIFFLSASRNGGEAAAMTGLVPVYPFMLLIALVFFYSPLKPPRMAALRRASAPVWARPFYALFAPGPAGTIFFETILIAAAMVFVGSLSSADPLATHSMDPERNIYSYILSLVIQVPFFVVFPAGWLFNFRRFSERPKAFRIAVFLWWVIAAAIMMVLGAIVTFIWRDRELGGLLDFIAILLSPITSFIAGAGQSDTSLIGIAAPGVRIACGLMGLVLMFRVIARRREVEFRANAARLAPAPSPAIAPEAAE